MGLNQNLDFTLKLNQLIEQTKQLKTRHQTIVVYGYGHVGQLVAPLLGERLAGIVDRAADGRLGPAGKPVEPPGALPGMGAECVLVTVLGREEEIIHTLRTELGWQGEIATYALRSPTPPGVPPFTPEDSRKLATLKGRFAGQRCVIIGNGPSLNHCDLGRLKDEFTFGVNGIFYKTEEMGFRPTFYVVEDSHVIDDNLETINAYECGYKFFPAAHRAKIRDGDPVYFFDYECGFYRQGSPHYGKPRFSLEADRVIYAGQTVTYTNMQLAAFMGFTEIYLVGVDFSYAVPKSTEIIGDTYISNEDDPNHFHPAYFGKGKKWHDPKLDRVLLNFECAKATLEARGVKIFNATKGGALELFPRVDYDRVFPRST